MSSDFRPPRRPSIAAWVFLNLLIVLFSYALILGVAYACVYLPYVWLTRRNGAEFEAVVLLVCGTVMSGAMLWALVPERDKFVPPGPLLEPTAHPSLFSEINRIAELLGERPPVEVYVIPQVNAFVTDRGGILGLGGRRVMGIGLPLAAILTTSELRAVFAHEFAHYYGGDTRLGPFIYKARIAVARSIQSLGSVQGLMRIWFVQIAYIGVIAILRTYWAIFFRATQGIARRQEYRADELACHIAGSNTVVEALRKIHGGNATFPGYWTFDVAPLLNAGYRPPVAEGFSMFVASSEISQRMQQAIQQEISNPKKNPIDSHPLLRDRITAAESVCSAGATPACSASAVTLFSDVMAEEERIFAMGAPEHRVASLKPISWDELPGILPSIWARVVRDNVLLLADFTPESIPDLIPKLPEIGAKIPDPKGMLLTPDQRTARAGELFGVAIALAIHNAGWPLSMKPGERFYQVGDQRISLREALGKLASKAMSKEEWAQLCATLKITGVPLAGVSAQARGI